MKDRRKISIIVEKKAEELVRDWLKTTNSGTTVSKGKDVDIEVRRGTKTVRLVEVKGDQPNKSGEHSGRPNPGALSNGFFKGLGQALRAKCRNRHARISLALTPMYTKLAGQYADVLSWQRFSVLWVSGEGIREGHGDSRNPFKLFSACGTCFNILAAHKDGLPKKELIRLLAEETGKDEKLAGFTVDVVTSAKDSNDGPRRPTCRPGFYVKQEGGKCKLYVDTVQPGHPDGRFVYRKATYTVKNGSLVSVKLPGKAAVSKMTFARLCRELKINLAACRIITIAGPSHRTHSNERSTEDAKDLDRGTEIKSRHRRGVSVRTFLPTEERHDVLRRRADPQRRTEDHRDSKG